MESYFSKTKHAKRINRASLRDELATATLHLQQLRVLHNVEKLQTFNSLSLDLERALEYVENSITQLRERYIDVKIVKPFFDDSIQAVRDYEGHVTAVEFVRDEGHHLFHIEYDSDSDDEDMELWEVKTYVRE